MKPLPFILVLLLTACASRNERYAYLVAPQVSDDQLATLRARDVRMRVFTSADGTQRWLTSPVPVDQLGAQVGAPRQNAPGTTSPLGPDFFPELIEGIVNGLIR